MDKTHLLLSTAVGLAFVVGAQPTIAGKKQLNGAKGHASIDFAKAPFKLRKDQQPRRHVLREKFLVETWGVTTVSLLGGFAVEDAAQKITCKAACTVVTENTAEILSYDSNNQVGICPMVDGYFTNGACYFSGTVQPADLYTNRDNQTNLSVGTGPHTLQTYIYTVSPAYLGHYQNDYHVYE